MVIKPASDLENELDIGHCTSWTEWVKTHGLAPLTVRNVVQGLRGFLVDIRGKGWARLREKRLRKKMVTLGGPLDMKGLVAAKKDIPTQLEGDDEWYYPTTPFWDPVRKQTSVGLGCGLSSSFEPVDVIGIAVMPPNFRDLKGDVEVHTFRINFDDFQKHLGDKLRFYKGRYFVKKEDMPSMEWLAANDRPPLTQS